MRVIPIFGAFFDHEGFLFKLFHSTDLTHLSSQPQQLSEIRSTYIQNNIGSSGHFQRQLIHDDLQHHQPLLQHAQYETLIPFEDHLDRKQSPDQ